jgi:hypothetical protein
MKPVRVHMSIGAIALVDVNLVAVLSCHPANVPNLAEILFRFFSQV